MSLFWISFGRSLRIIHPIRGRATELEDHRRQDPSPWQGDQQWPGGGKKESTSPLVLRRDGWVFAKPDHYYITYIYIYIDNHIYIYIIYIYISYIYIYHIYIYIDDHIYIYIIYIYIYIMYIYNVHIYIYIHIHYIYMWWEITMILWYTMIMISLLMIYDTIS